MKRVFWRFGLPLALAGWAPAQPQGDIPPAITVYTQFQHSYSTAALAEMKRETAAIMGPLGLDFNWRSLGASHGEEVTAELVVVTFEGDCGINRLDMAGRGELGALGWTHMSDGVVLPFSGVDCDKIRRFIAPEMRALDPKLREIAYGRALGRVLAHELYHVFTNTTHHGAWGVAKASYTSRDLVADHFEFEAKDTRALRNGRLEGLLRYHRRPPVLGLAGARP